MAQQLIKATEQAKKSETKKATTKKTYKPKPPKDITLEDVKQWISAIEHFENLNQFLAKFPNTKDEELVKKQIAQVAQEVSAINFAGKDLSAFFTKTTKALKEAK